MIITICVTLFLSLLALHVILRYNKTQRVINKIPGPTPLPFFGSLPILNMTTKNNTTWDIICHLLDKYYPILRINGVTTNLLFLRHPEDMKILSSCKTNLDKSETAYGTITSLGQDGILISGGEKWQQRRKMLNPAFSPESIKIYIEIVNEHAVKLVENIKKQNHDLVPDLVEIMNKLAMDVICEAIMATDSDIYDSEEAEEFRNGIREICEVIIYRTSRPYLKDWMMRFLSMGRRTQKAVNTTNNFTKKFIQKRREYHKKIGYQQLKNEGDDDVFKSERKRLAVLDLLLTAERDGLIDEAGIIEETQILIIAGFETSGLTATFALMLLAENPEAQNLARDEVTEIMNHTGGMLTVADLTELNYLDRCIKETLRLFPSAPLFGRKITHEIKLSDYKIPPGTEVFVHLFALHRDPNFWPDPEKFDPDRFLPENVKERHPFAYMPFSGGLRSCIGQKFAMLEVKAIVARMLFNFYLEPVESTADMKFDLEFTLKPISPCRIRLIKINRH